MEKAGHAGGKRIWFWMKEKKSRRTTGTEQKNETKRKNGKMNKEDREKAEKREKSERKWERKNESKKE
jgi:hypothetical protein